MEKKFNTVNLSSHCTNHHAPTVTHCVSPPRAQPTTVTCREERKDQCGGRNTTERERERMKVEKRKKKKIKSVINIIIFMRVWTVKSYQNQIMKIVYGYSKKWHGTQKKLQFFFSFFLFQDNPNLCTKHNFLSGAHRFWFTI